MRVDKFLSMEITLKSSSANSDEYGQPMYEPARTVKGLIQDKSQVVQNSYGEYITVTSSVFTNVPVKEHDLINDRMVEAVLVMRDVRGRIQGYEATLK